MAQKKSQGISRREMFQTAGLAIPLYAGLTGETAQAAAAAPQQETVGSAALNRFPRMVQEYFVSKVRLAEQARLATVNRLRTRQDAEAYVADVRRRIKESFGAFPEKTPLNAKVTGSLDRDAYKIEKIVFESRPGFLVTANLYVPKGRTSPMPGVIGTCGHMDEGKAGDAYQSFAQGLARQGYVVLIYDPIGQGERLQYLDAGMKSRVGIGVREHLKAGNQQFLIGEFFGAWRAWDGIRALDYLLSRPEVDSRHVGVTGNSGGGTMTTWLCGLEDRWTMAAPGCFVTTFRHNLENELSADTEQCPPRVLALGLDHEDFLAAMAPKPIIILSKEKDFFDVRGTEEAYGRLKRLYGLLGAEENITLFTGPTEHGYTLENREAMYKFFNRVTGASTAAHEPKLTLEKIETLECTPRGQVGPLGSRTVFSFTAQTAKEKDKHRASLSGDGLKQVLKDALKIPAGGITAPDYRILRPLGKQPYPKPFFTTYAVETEEGVQAIVYRLSEAQHLSRPPQGAGPVLLYVSHQSSDDELRNEPLVRQLADEHPEMPVFTCDLRGIGDSRPGTCGTDSFRDPYGSDYFYAVSAIMFDYPYVAQRTYDLLRVLEWLAAQGHEGIHVAANGWGTIPATFASVLSDRVGRVTLKNAPESYSAIAQAEDYAWPLSSLLPGVLDKFDLPDCYRELKSKQLRRL